MVEPRYSLVLLQGAIQGGPELEFGLRQHVGQALPEGGLVGALGSPCEGGAVMLGGRPFSDEDVIKGGGVNGATAQCGKDGKYEI